MTDEHSHPDYIGMMLKHYSWLCQKPRVIGHVSDLIMCVRQRVFQELDPQPPTETQMNFYSSGKAIHEVIQNLLASDPGRFDKEHKVYYQGMSGSVDVYDKRYNIPIEFKTPRKDGPLKEPASYNLEQLKTYMSILNTDCGCLIYQFLSAKKVNYQICWIHMTKGERSEQLDRMKLKLTNLEQAVELQEPAMAEGVWDNWQLGWLCSMCPYLKQCEQMR